VSLSISVVIPAYNAEKFIRRALESVENQTTPPREVIVVDDGSTDSTSSCVEEFARQSALRILLVRQHNQGSSAARNHGIEKSNCDLLTFLDADDLIYPDFLEKTTSALVRFTDWAACFSDRDVVDTEGQLISLDLDHPVFRQIKKKEMGDHYVELADDDLFSKMLTGSVIPMTVTCRKSFVDAVGGFDETLLFNEDRLFFLQLIKQNGRLGYFNGPLGIWQRHATNKTDTSNTLDAIKYSDKLLQRLLADKDALRLSAAEVSATQAVRLRLGSQWIYAASRTPSSPIFALGCRLLMDRRITIGCFLKAMARAVLSPQ
jgi:glycosyltransferase involved in cell wall biosynthesis